METNRERVIDRLDKYMKDKGINDNQLTKMLKLGVGTIGKSREPNRDLSRANVERVLNKLLDLNPVWLLTGEGAMLRPIVIADNGSIAAGGDVSGGQTGGGDRSLAEKVKALETENAYLRGQVDLLMQLVKG